MRTAKLEQCGGNQLKRSTLFDVSPISDTDLTFLKSKLADVHQRKLAHLIQVIKQQIGEFQQTEVHSYRVTNTNYLKVKFNGSTGYFHLSITLTGYTEFPDIDENNVRVNFSLIDNTDAHWLIQIIEGELRSLENMSNDVD